MEQIKNHLSSICWIILKDTERFLRFMKAKTKTTVISNVLFVLTLITTTIGGCAIAGVSFLDKPWVGLPFSIGVMTILLCHEMGHYLMCQKHKVDCTPPFFLPSPFGLGTFGAVIAIKGKIPNRRVLFDIGAWGPIAGFIVTIPILFLGLMLSEIKPVTEGAAKSFDLFSAPTLLSTILLHITHFSDLHIIQKIPQAAGMNVQMHGLAVAGTIGLLITMLNLFPVGQLDGGHIAHALFGYRMANTIASFAIVLMIALGVFVSGAFIGMLIVVLLFGGKSRKPLPQPMKLDKHRKWLGFAMLAVFILCLPIPF